MKKCSRCEQSKDNLRDFRKIKNHTRPDCRDCENKRRRSFYRLHRESELKKDKIYSMQPKVIEHRLFKKYHISTIELMEIRKKQGNKCSICKQEVFLEIDHCHKTNKVRGLLCGVCNKSLGFIEKEGFLEKALEYLRLH